MSDPDPIATFEAPDAIRLASLFPGYEIDCLIATGGMGAVYRAVQLSLDRPVAIKILPREFGEDESFRASFEAEAKAMARLNHPNLIGVYDFGEVAGMLFIVMEFVPGKTLFHSAHGIAIAPDEAARIVTDVCLGLAHAHEHGILHRDIKPGNILLDQHARPKIGDFGLARPIGTAVEDGETIFGTPHYTAPEVLKYPNSVGVRADIFSVGVVLHELLTGRLPANDPRPPSVICGCDHRFDAIIRRATHPSADLRYTSAAEMAKDLCAITHAFPGQISRLRSTVPPGTRPAPLPRAFASAADSSGGMLVLAVVGVAAALVAAIFIVLKRPASPSTDTDPVPPPSSAPAPTPPRPTVERTPKPLPETVEWKPAPKPEPIPESIPEPVIAKTDPVPVKPAPAPLPSFDVPAFFDRVRGIMRQKAAPIIAAYEKDLVKNFEAFERSVKREVRKLDKSIESTVETLADGITDKWRSDGLRLPKTLELPEDKADKGGGRRPGPRGGPGGGPSAADQEKDFRAKFKDLHAKSLAKQNKLDQKLELDMLELSATYILGLTKQIERLTDPVELPSVALLRTEIGATQDKPHYFTDLMRGIDPNAPKEPAAGANAKADPDGKN
ncbi:MAG: serine/threonine-protein kinase [Verrucomicrobia bacterium]|nr:serine/threonine-protein kinase [Verrucomicrobiota bacterium]